MSKNWTKLLALIVMFCMLFSIEAFAGKGKTGCNKKPGFFAKIGKAIKNATQKTAKAVKKATKKTGQAIKTAAKKTGTAIKTAAKKTGKAIKNAAIKTGKAIKVAGAKINNAIKDTGVAAKYKLFGCKKKVWVVGHYDKNGKWTKGHWRKMEAKPVNHPGQGNNPGQGNFPGQTEEPLPPIDDGSDQPSPDPVLPEFPGEGDVAGSEGSAGGDSSEADPASPAPEEPAPEDPVLPELPGDDASDEGDVATDEPEADQPEAGSGNSDQAGQSGQSSQAGQTTQAPEADEEEDEEEQSGEADQDIQKLEDEQISLRTMGMLMNDLVKQSGEITSFKRNVVPGMNFSMDVQENLNGTYESREENARLLVKVVVWDLQRNNGAAGEYFTYFTYKMGQLDADSRQLIQDVTKRVQDGVVHGAGHVNSDEEKSVYKQRMEDIQGF